MYDCVTNILHHCVCLVVFHSFLHMVAVFSANLSRGLLVSCTLTWAFHYVYPTTYNRVMTSVWSGPACCQYKVRQCDLCSLKTENMCKWWCCMDAWLLSVAPLTTFCCQFVIFQYLSKYANVNDDWWYICNVGLNASVSWFIIIVIIL